MQLRQLLVVAGVALVTACGASGETPLATESPSIRPSPAEASEVSAAASESLPANEDIYGFIDLGGREVFVTCTGEGSPAVVLESGDESGVLDWERVQPRVAEATKVCAYDRPGTGSSDPATGCRGSEELRHDLELLLDAIALEPPYVLVGSSGGGYLAVNYAYAHPDDVAGLVLLDTFRAIDPKRADAELIEELTCTSPLNEEHRDYVSVEHDAWDNRRRIGAFPMAVVTNDYGTAATSPDERTNVREQRGWLKLSPQSRQVVVTSGHDIAFAEADLVVEEILRVVEAGR